MKQHTDALRAVWEALLDRCASTPRKEWDKVTALVRVTKEDVAAALKAAQPIAGHVDCREVLEECAEVCDDVANPAKGIVCDNLSPSGQCQRSGHRDCLCQERQETAEALAISIRALASAPAAPNEKGNLNMTEDQIKHMVDRFLNWKLPADFNPDCGIHFDAEAAIKMNPCNARYEPVGTNLLTATDANAMVRHMLDGLPLAPAASPGNEAVVESVTKAIFEAFGEDVVKFAEASGFSKRLCEHLARAALAAINSTE